MKTTKEIYECLKEAIDYAVFEEDNYCIDLSDEDGVWIDSTPGYWFMTPNTRIEDINELHDRVIDVPLKIEGAADEQEWYETKAFEEALKLLFEDYNQDRWIDEEIDYDDSDAYPRPPYY